MKKQFIFGVFIFASLWSGMALMSDASASGASERTPKYLAYVFTPKTADFERRYHTGTDNAYNSDWEYPLWSPYDWAQNPQQAQSVIDGFYYNNVIERQYVDRKTQTPVIEVGQTWLNMSGRDKMRTVKFIAYAFGYNTQNDVIELTLKRNNTCHPMGIYANGRVQLF